MENGKLVTGVIDNEPGEKQWSDPLVFLQFMNLQAYVKRRSEPGVPASAIEEVAQYVSEASGNLLNATHGCTTKNERREITEFFNQAAGQIEECARRLTDIAQWQRIWILVQRIRQKAQPLHPSPASHFAK